MTLQKLHLIWGEPPTKHLLKDLQNTKANFMKWMIFFTKYEDKNRHKVWPIDSLKAFINLGNDGCLLDGNINSAQEFFLLDWLVQQCQWAACTIRSLNHHLHISIVIIVVVVVFVVVLVDVIIVFLIVIVLLDWLVQQSTVSESAMTISIFHHSLPAICTHKIELCRQMWHW